MEGNESDSRRCGRHKGDLDEDEEERRHFQHVLNSLLYYKEYSLDQLAARVHDFSKLSSKHKAMLPTLSEDFATLRCCIEHNAEIMKLIVRNACNVFQNVAYTLKDSANDDGFCRIRVDDMDKVRTTIKQFVRDWSSDGQAERDQCYAPIISALQRFLPLNGNTKTYEVLVPGAGLARLVFEIARLGYNCQGCEFSAYMLFASNFVLNRLIEPDSLLLYPWIHSWSNNFSFADQTKAVRFPDVCPHGNIPQGVNFSMAAGDFLDVYCDHDQWDCIPTVFFIDTAHNVIEYIERIFAILKPGGYWINLGPLLYHFADVSGADSIELSYEQIRSILLNVGFHLVEEKRLRCSYIQNPNSMLLYEYNCAYFVAQKPRVAS